MKSISVSWWQTARNGHVITCVFIQLNSNKDQKILKWIDVIYGINRFLFWVCGCSYSKVMTIFQESCMKKGKWWLVICNYKQLYKYPCISSTELKQIMKGSPCYSESIYVHFSLNKSIWKELWIFFAYV